MVTPCVFIICYLALVSRSRVRAVKTPQAQATGRGEQIQVAEVYPYNLAKMKYNFFPLTSALWGKRRPMSQPGIPTCRCGPKRAFILPGRTSEARKEDASSESRIRTSAARDGLLRRTERGNPKSGGERLLSQVRGTYAEIQYWRQQRRLTEKAAVVSPHHLHKSFPFSAQRAV